MSTNDNLNVSNNPIPTNLPQSDRRKPNQNKSNNRRRGQQSRTRHDEEFRERVGATVEDERRNAILKRLHADEFQLAAIVSPSSSIANFAAPIPIATRAIGLITNETIERIKRVFQPERVQQAGNVYQMFLGSLAQFYLHMESAERKSELTFKRCYSRPVQGLASQMDQIIRSNAQNFRPIVSLIETVGITKHQDIYYVPVIPEPEVSDQEFVPNPFYVNLSNLRHTLLYLSDSETSFEIRRFFMFYNSLPGSRWDVENAILLNPDDYYQEYPGDIGQRSLRNAFQGIKSLLTLTKSKLPNIALLGGESPCCSFSGLGDPSMLVSVEVDNGPRLEDVVVVGPYDERFYSSVPLTSDVLIRGAINRVGEFCKNDIYLEIKELRPLIFAQRNPHQACRAIDIQWLAMTDKMLE